MSEPELSIIVPIYNSEKYLKKCIESILCQSYKDFELILINDGSTDNSIEICKHYVKKDSRVNLVNKKNTGSSDTRNIGINQSKGKYISFIDSDDWIEANMLDHKINLAKKYNLDMVISGICFDKVDSSGNIISTINNYNDVLWLNKNEVRSNIINIFPNALINSSCNKIYKSELIKSNKIKFKSTEIGEDTLFNIDIIKEINTIGIIHNSYYHYMKYENNNTLTTKIIDNAYDKYIYIHKEIIELFSSWNITNNETYSKINETMFAQYFATTLKILSANNSKYSYKEKKKMLDDGLKKKMIIDTFDYSNPFSYKEKIFRFIIKNRHYHLAITLLKINKIKLNIGKLYRNKEKL